MTNNSVNFLIPHCFFGLHLTLKLVFGLLILNIEHPTHNTFANYAAS